MKKSFFVPLVLGVLIGASFTPFVVGAASSVLTVSSLSGAYTAQINADNAQIVALQKDANQNIANAQGEVKYNNLCSTLPNASFNDATCAPTTGWAMKSTQAITLYNKYLTASSTDSAQITQLTQDKHTLQVAYQLLQGAL